MHIHSQPMTNPVHIKLFIFFIFNQFFQLAFEQTKDTSPLVSTSTEASCARCQGSPGLICSSAAAWASKTSW